MAKYIKFNDVSFSYNEPKSNKEIELENLNFEVREGTNIGLIGPNGSGKSTLLRLAAGIFKPLTGHINSTFINPYLFGSASILDPHLSGYDNVRLINKIIKNTIIDEKEINHIKSYSGLDDKFYDSVKTYSKGMLARLNFSISIVINSDLLLIDEALSGGDQEFRKKAIMILNDKMRDGKITSIVVSHNFNMLEKMTSESIVIKNSKIIFRGTTKKAIEYYNKFI